jgi:hypothetical protein
MRDPSGATRDGVASPELFDLNLNLGAIPAFIRVTLKGFKVFRAMPIQPSLRLSSGLGLRGAPELRSVVLGWGLRSITGRIGETLGAPADLLSGRYTCSAAPRSSERGAAEGASWMHEQRRRVPRC